MENEKITLTITKEHLREASLYQNQESYDIYQQCLVAVAAREKFGLDLHSVDFWIRLKSYKSPDLRITFYSSELHRLINEFNNISLPSRTTEEKAELYTRLDNSLPITLELSIYGE